jgi:hypothetical protein
MFCSFLNSTKHFHKLKKNLYLDFHVLLLLFIKLHFFSLSCSNFSLQSSKLFIIWNMSFLFGVVLRGFYFLGHWDLEHNKMGSKWKKAKVALGLNLCMLFKSLIRWWFSTFYGHLWEVVWCCSSLSLANENGSSRPTTATVGFLVMKMVWCWRWWFGGGRDIERKIWCEKVHNKFGGNKHMSLRYWLAVPHKPSFKNH